VSTIQPQPEISQPPSAQIFVLCRRGVQGQLGPDLRPRTRSPLPRLLRPFLRMGTLAVRIEGHIAADGSRRIDQEGCIAADPAMLGVLLDATLFAASNAPVLIEGETGVGKEVIARWIHAQSSRKKEPWEAINCATLSGQLADSELFGHEAGAFTGATRRHVGILERAGNGTVLLDELGELPSPIQAHLLRALETGEFRRVGGERMIPLRARVLAATHRNLDEAVRTREFRADLLHRLAVLRLRIPPLRERPLDLAWIAHTITRSLPEPVALTPGLLTRLSHHTWPGNIRELRNELIRGSVLGPQSILPRTSFSSPSLVSSPRPSNVLERQRDQAILRELIRQGGSRKRTHQALGIPRSTFYRWLQTHPAEVDAALVPRISDG